MSQMAQMNANAGSLGVPARRLAVALCTVVGTRRSSSFAGYLLLSLTRKYDLARVNVGMIMAGQHPEFKILAWVAVAFLLNSCGGHERASQYDDIPESDKECQRELAKARADVANRRLVYCHHAGSLGYFGLRSGKELAELLEKHDIEFTEEMTSDVIVEGHTQWCYCGLMEEQIATTHGENFIDSLIDVSDDWFVKNSISNGDTIYYGECDVRPRYPGDDEHPDEFSRDLQTEMEGVLRYPRGYLQRPNYDSSAFVDIRFVVDTSGQASIIHYRFLFDMDANHQYKDTLMGQIERSIRLTGWEPGRVRGRKVKADMNYRVDFE